MSTLLLLGLFANTDKNEIVANSTGVIQYAAHALQNSILTGISQLRDDVEIINLPYIGSYPYRYKKMYYKGSASFEESGVAGTNVGFNNLFVYKLYSRYFNTKKAVMKWAAKQQGDKFVLVYALHTPFIKAVVEVKKVYPDLHICLIVPDLPEFMGTSTSFAKTLYSKKNKALINDLICYADSFVLLSKYMVEGLNIGDKPWTVVEGIFNPKDQSIENISNVSAESEKKQIFYSGTLARRYGIMNLVDAFMSLKHEDIELVICGNGDTREGIIEKSEEDSRIIYKGQLPREEILALQQSAFLLVNPRTAEGEFTKYSFPSKTMEYLASGTPTLLYRLLGIPDEYYDYCFSLDSSSIEDLANKMDEIIKMDPKVLKGMGEKAREFILTEKNPVKQCEKITKLLYK